MCQILFRRAVDRGELKAVSFRMPGAPFTSWLTLAFLVGVLVLMAFDYPGGTWTIATIPVVVLALVVGWKLAKRGAAREQAADALASSATRTVADPVRAPEDGMRRGASPVGAPAPRDGQFNPVRSPTQRPKSPAISAVSS